MSLSLSTPDGEEVEVTPVEMPDDVKAASGAFHRAQANDPLADERMRPPKRAPKPVEVSGDDAPRTANPKRTRASKADAARTTAKVPDSQKPITPKDFRADLAATGDGIWLGLSQIPVTAPYAAVFHGNQAGIVETLNQGAQVNHGVRNFVERLTSGAGNAWVLQGAVVGMNIGMQMWAVYRDPEFRAQVAEANKAQVQQYVDAISGAQLAGT